MRSSNVTTKHEGVVRCRIVHEEIPERICGFEQGVPECTGCTASTRRCTACGKTRGIADPEQGWCESCVEKRGSSAPRQALEGSPAMALTKALDRVRTVSAQLGETKGPIAQKGVGPSQALPGPMRVMSDPAAFYPLLMEHGVEREGIWSVKAPVVLLMHRTHLLRHEAGSILSVLAQNEFIEGKEPWNSIVLLKTEGIEDIKRKAEGTRAQPRDEQTKQRKIVPPAGSKSTSEDILATLPSRRPVATHKDVYAYLIERSNVVRGERLVGGANPMVRIRFKLTPEQTNEALDWLLQNGHVTQKDGWRTIILTSEQVDSTDGPVNAPQKTDKAPTPVRDEGQRDQRKSAERLPKMPIPRAEPRPKVTQASSMAADKKGIETALEQLEHALPSLRGKRDELTGRIARLEAVYAGLKSLQTQLQDADSEAGAALYQAAVLATDLLSSLTQADN